MHDVICYRCSHVNPIRDVAKRSIVNLKQFISTSVVESRTFNGRYRVSVCAKKGTTVAYFEILSENPNQRELLLDKDCVY